VQVKNMKTVAESLDKLILEDDVADFDCATCGRKVPLMKKRSILQTLPPVLIVQVCVCVPRERKMLRPVHACTAAVALIRCDELVCACVCDLSRQCNRFVFNFDTFQHEKLNTRFEFPRQLNLEPFTREGVAWRRSKAEHDAALAAAAGGDAGDAGGESEAKGGDGDSTSAAAARPGDSVSAGAAAPSGDAGVSAGGDGGVSASGDAAVLEPYTVHPREYYEYRLKGIVVHSGTANSGHYYSFIRDGSPADAALDADDVESLRRERWYRFDDSSVTEFPMTEETLETEAFGGFVEQWETDEYGRAVNVKREQVLCCAVLCCAVLCCAVLCCAVLCCAVLCCAVLC
jgi:hypothetical protein